MQHVNILTDKDAGISEAGASFAQLEKTQPLLGKRILIVVENLPVPFDRRVWMEARTLKAAGADVSVICPTGKGFDKREEMIEGIHVYRHSLPVDASGALGYLMEYGAALFHEIRLTLKVWHTHGIDVIQGCNPPDLIFLVALPLKLFGIRYIFDHHDINPELYEAKFEQKGFFWWLMTVFEKLTFKDSQCIDCNQSELSQNSNRAWRHECRTMFILFVPVPI